MLNFHTYMARYGEFWIQDIVERIERHEDIQANIGASLEDRWNALMQPASLHL